MNNRKIISVGGIIKSIAMDSATDSLPQGNYIVKFDDQHGFHLVEKPTFKLPSKIYGDTSIVDRWLRSYKENSEKNMGIVLSGLKGTGKTILAQKFCIDSGMPTIIVSDTFEGAGFTDFITQFDNSIIFIDEFEKLYHERAQCSNELLSIMDGNFQTKLVFLLTVNDMSINSFLVNRLGRVKYRKHFKDLEEDVMEAVIKDMLVNQAHASSIEEFFKVVNMRSLDLLVNLIKEMNLFEEDALQCGAHLNLSPETRYYTLLEVFKDGTIVTQYYGLACNINGKQIIGFDTTIPDPSWTKAQVSANSWTDIPLSDAKIVPEPGGSFRVSWNNRNFIFRSSEGNGPSMCF